MIFDKVTADINDTILILIDHVTDDVTEFWERKYSASS